MEAEPTDSTSCPRWVLLNRYSYPRDSGVADADAKTTSAATFTSTGRPFAVSFCLKAPPASSSFFYDWLDGREHCMEEPQVIAVHGDCLLIEMVAPGDRQTNSSASLDYFLYDAGAARLPSLSLLPACFYPMNFERGMTRHYPQARVMRKEDTGILRRGEDELLVAQLEVTAHGAAELCVLRLGRSEWELNRAVRIVHGEETGSIGDEPMRRWQADAVVPVGDRFLCWVDYFRGILLGDMAADVASLRLVYVPLPVEPGHGWQWPSFDGSRPDPRWSMNLAAAGAAALRFVSVEPRRRGSGDTTFTVTTWTLRLMTEELAVMTTWVMDSVLDCGELWGFPGYEGVPRVTVKYPIVSLDDADVVCFMVTEDDYVYREGTRIWMVKVDTRRKTLRSVACYMSDRWGEGYHVAAKLQC